MVSDLHRPLGTNRADKSSHNDTFRYKDGKNNMWFGTLCAGVILGGSIYTSFAPDNIQNQTKRSAEKLAQTDQISEPTDHLDDQSQNITQQVLENTNPDKNQVSIEQLSGQSGGTIKTTLTPDGLEITKITPRSRQSDQPIILNTDAKIGQERQIAHLPDEAIYEESQYGKLPIYGENGERAFDIYARPWSGTRGTRIAIVVGGLGLSQTGSQYAIRTLPEDITLGFAGNGNSLGRWMQEARRKGHEIIMQVPFEPFDYPNINPGPGTLITSQTMNQNLDSLHRAMGKTTNYVGIGNFMGGKFLTTPEAVEPIMRDIAKRGIMFFDDGSSSRSLSQTYAKTFGIPFAASDILLDANLNKGDILKKLDDLERIARRNGQAIGVASAFTETIDAIAAWSNEAKARGIEFVGVAAIANDPERR